MTEISLIVTLNNQFNQPTLLSQPTSFYTLTKQNFYRVILLSVGKKHHLGSISLKGTSMMYCPYTTQTLNMILPYVSCWTWDQRHDREQLFHFCLLPRCTIVEMEGRSTSHFHLWQTWQYDFKFHITNFPFLSSSIPSAPVNGVFISQVLRYARVCS